VGTMNTSSFFDTQLHVLYDDQTNFYIGNFSTFLVNGYRINFTTANGTARKWFALGIGDLSDDGRKPDIMPFFMNSLR